MTITTADSLVTALRDSGLLTPAQLAAVAPDLSGLGGDTQSAMRHLVQSGLVTVHQLRKVVHGKQAELFVGPYVVVDKIGEGGMGKVYKARDGRTGRTVGLKVVRPHLLANPVVRGRYEREVKTARALKHKHVVEVFDDGRDGDRHYLAMEFVDGIDLSRLVRTHGAISGPEAAEYLRQAALGLQYAHDQGVVHRDIKPSNVIVSGERFLPTAEGPTLAQILDMGLVRWIGGDDSDHGTDLTRDGTVVGTPDYMAPEQAKNSKTIDHRADLYSLGGTFYFLLTGQPPFPNGSPIEKILKHQLDPPPSLAAARPDVSDELVRVVRKLMAKKPDARFGSAAELAEALAPLTRHAPEPAARPAVVIKPKTIPRPPSTVDQLPVGALPEVKSGPVKPAPPRPKPKPELSPADRTPGPPSGKLTKLPPPTARGPVKWVLAALAVVVALFASVGLVGWAFGAFK